MTIIPGSENFFLSGLLRRAQEKRVPCNTMFELTRRCNFRCPHCYLESKNKNRKELDTAEVFSVLDQLKELGVWFIGFTGGEPLLRKDIFLILDHANRRGFKFGLITNGFLITAGVADRLKQTNIEKVAVTLNYLDPKVFDLMSGVKDSLFRVKQGIESLAGRDIQVIIKSLATNENKDQLAAVSAYARSLGIYHELNSRIFSCGGRCHVRREELSLNAAEVDALRRKIYPEMFIGSGKRREIKLSRRRDRVFTCGIGVSSFTVNSYGKMDFCLSIDYPGHDILLEGAAGCWKKLNLEADRINNGKHPPCGKCGVFDYCDWCPAMSFRESGRFNLCSSFVKKNAERGKQEWAKRKSLGKAPM